MSFTEFPLSSLKKITMVSQVSSQPYSLRTARILGHRIFVTISETSSKDCLTPLKQRKFFFSPMKQEV